jgi:hypothetical protein
MKERIIEYLPLVAHIGLAAAVILGGRRDWGVLFWLVLMAAVLFKLAIISYLDIYTLFATSDIIVHLKAQLSNKHYHSCH